MMPLRRLFPILCAVAGVIVVHQLSILWEAFPGTDLATPAGRVREAIALEAKSAALLTADVLLIWTAVHWADPRWLRRLGLAQIPIAVLLLLAIPLFLSDAGRVAGSFGGPELRAFRVVVARTLLSFLLLGFGMLKASRALLDLARQPAAIPVP